MRLLLNILSDCLKGNKLNLIDIGASGGIHPRWKKFANLLIFIGFEPDLKECLKLSNDSSHRWYNIALAGQEGKRTLYLTQEQSNSSFLRPNYGLLRNLEWSLKGPEYDFGIREEVQVACISLDNFLCSQRLELDFLKVDTQGTELEILRGGSKALLENCILAEIEVEFFPIYEDQPLFPDIDIFMRDCGFVLHDLGNFLWIKPRGMSGVGGPKGRIISCDALYLRDINSFAEKFCQEEDKKVIASLIGYLAYGYPELALSLLDLLRENKKEIYRHRIIREHISNLKIPSQKLLWMPYRNFFLKALRKICANLTSTEHFLWDMPLGNQSSYRE